MYLPSVLIFTLLSFTNIAFAQSSAQFEIGLDVVDVDDEAPTVPGNLSAAAITTTRIDLSWDAATDNVAVAGYNVFRDSAFLASTTATAYTDSGLSEATTYAYTISAFDAAGNESARSATATETTLSQVAAQGGGGALAPEPTVPRILNLEETPQREIIVIRWQTDVPTRGTLVWGETPEYELGTIKKARFATEQTARLSDLTPDTEYHIALEVETRAGRTARSGNRVVVTLPPIDLTAPANPSGFAAVPREDAVELFWENPVEEDFSHVRLLKSHKFFPRDPFDGELLYEGDGEAITDEDTEPGTTYYYTLFARDTEGNYSSGAIARAHITAPAPQPEAPSAPQPHPGRAPKPTADDPFVDVPLAPGPHPQIEELTLEDFEFVQGGTLLKPFNKTIAIDGSKNLTIRIDYDTVPEVLKTIAIALQDPHERNKSFAFLLRVDEEKQAYSATIAPLARSGDFPLSIIVLDHKHRGLKRISGTIVASVETPAYETERSTSAVVGAITAALLSAALLLLLVLLFFVLKRRRGRKGKGDQKGWKEVAISRHS